jgi:hydrophobic/amphiphilic exporter-1 (mainly G- bacteria), HAE1 family
MKTRFPAAVRRNLLLSLLVALFFSLSPGLAFTARADESDIEIITLDEALLIARDQNRDVQKAREYKNWVEAKVVEERSAALPQLTITAAAAANRDESQRAYGTGFPTQTRTASAEIGLSQALFTWGQVGAAIRAAKVGVATADEQLRIYRQAALRDVSVAFYDILLARELNKIALQNLEIKKRHHDEARKRHAAGVATDYDVLVEKVAEENARPEVIRTENLIRLARDRLRFLLGRNGREIDVAGSLMPAIGPAPAFGETLLTAVKSRPELSNLRLRADVAKELVKIAEAGDKPRLDLKAGYGYRGLDFGQETQTTTTTKGGKDVISTQEMKAQGEAWTVGLYVTFPLFDGLRTRGKVAQAKSDMVTLKIEEAKLLDGIRLEVRDACNAVRESAETAQALSGTVSQAERLLFMAEKGLEYGVKTRLDVEDAQFNLVSARGTLARARRDYLVARVTHEWVSGTLGENGKP